MWRLIPEQDNLGASASSTRSTWKPGRRVNGRQSQDAVVIFTKLMKSKLRLQLIQVRIYYISEGQDKGTSTKPEGALARVRQ